MPKCFQYEKLTVRGRTEIWKEHCRQAEEGKCREVRWRGRNRCTMEEVQGGATPYSEKCGGVPKTAKKAFPKRKKGR